MKLRYWIYALVVAVFLPTILIILGSRFLS